jgi:hypothetical protein
MHFNKVVNSDKLINEIRESAIVVALDYIDGNSEGCDIFFKAELSLDDQAILTTLVDAHDPTPIPVTDIIKVESATPLETTDTSPKNEHCMEPWGCIKGVVNPSEHTFDIVLSNKSEDGRTFTYNPEVAANLHVGNYVFQNDFCNRSWIESIDTENSTITFELAELDNGSGIYCMGYYMDTKVRDWKPLMYLWGLTINLQCEQEVLPLNDFVELSIVDHDDLFLNEDFVQAVFGCSAQDVAPILESMGFENNGEYEHWTKYYDETWVINVKNKYTNTTDGAPGELLSGLYLRLSYFAGNKDTNKRHVFVDYYPTSK